MSKVLITAKDLTIGYANSQKHSSLYQSLNFELKAGELTTIMGVNGAGKSTLIKTICGIIPPISGDIYINENNISKFNRVDISKHIGIVLTERVADGGLTGWDVVSLGRYNYTGFFGKISEEDKRIIEQSMQSVGILDLSTKQIANMSDGERQKVMIAKSLCQQSEIIILDEPTAFLDIRSRIETMQLLRDCAKKQNKAILISSHDLEQSIQYSDNLWVMAKNEGLYCNTTEDAIISGVIEKIVGNDSNLYMDYKTGVFATKNNPNALNVKVQGSDTFLVKNAIRRELINICDEANVTISVNSFTDIDIITKLGSSKVNSIKEIVSKLKTYNYNDIN